jgi:hypothetical protein
MGRAWDKLFWAWARPDILNNLDWDQAGPRNDYIRPSRAGKKDILGPGLDILLRILTYMYIGPT